VRELRILRAARVRDVVSVKFKLGCENMNMNKVKVRVERTGERGRVSRSATLETNASLEDIISSLRMFETRYDEERGNTGGRYGGRKPFPSLVDANYRGDAEFMVLKMAADGKGSKKIINALRREFKTETSAAQVLIIDMIGEGKLRVLKGGRLEVLTRQDSLLLDKNINPVMR
jgi:hypothetical protein